VGTKPVYKELCSRSITLQFGGAAVQRPGKLENVHRRQEPRQRFEPGHRSSFLIYHFYEELCLNFFQEMVAKVFLIISGFLVRI